MRCGGDWKRDYGGFYTGTQGETLDTAKELPTDDRASPRPYQGRTYDVSPDGQRFLMIKVGGASDETSAPRSIIVVEHWFEELKRLVPTN